MNPQIYTIEDIKNMIRDILINTIDKNSKIEKEIQKTGIVIYEK